MKQIKIDVIGNGRFSSRHQHIFDLLNETGRYNINYITAHFNNVEDIHSCLRKDADIVWTGRPWEKALLTWNVPYVLTLRGLFWEEEQNSSEFDNKIGMQVAVKASAIISLSNYGKQKLEDQNYQLAKKISVIPNGIVMDDLSEPSNEIVRINRNPEKIPEDKLVLLTVSNFSFESKGNAVKELIYQYTKDIRYQRHLFIIAGGGPYFKIVDLDRKERKNIKYTGFYKDIGGLYSRADIFLYHSYQDVQPTVLLEAAKAGLPVLASNRCGMEDWIQHGSSGYICNDLPEMMNRTKELIADRQKRLRMGEASRNFAQEKFTWEKSAAGYDAIFKEIVNAN